MASPNDQKGRLEKETINFTDSEETLGESENNEQSFQDKYYGEGFGEHGSYYIGIGSCKPVISTTN